MQSISKECRRQNYGSGFEVISLLFVFFALKIHITDLQSFVPAEVKLKQVEANAQETGFLSYVANRKRNIKVIEAHCWNGAEKLIL